MNQQRTILREACKYSCGDFCLAESQQERIAELEARLAAVPDDMVLVPRKEILFYIGRIAALKSALSGMLPDGIEDWCDECGGDPARCSGECDVRIGKVILTQKDKP